MTRLFLCLCSQFRCPSETTQVFAQLPRCLAYGGGHLLLQLFSKLTAFGEPLHIDSLAGESLEASMVLSCCKGAWDMLNGAYSLHLGLAKFVGPPY